MRLHTALCKNVGAGEGPRVSVSLRRLVKYVSAKPPSFPVPTAQGL